ncbi:unnamed protein product [Lactuca saligna]|uniref:Uncharacterized protein n=1 Tax=Lactuca saligna TaxID=75948 RepID=A0AA35ZJF6_LACSI|nr:unnamed protein product [Lactuca saligna]
MASSPNPTYQNFIVVDFHYNGQFAPNPLVYFDPDRASVRDLDFSGFGESENKDLDEDEDSVIQDSYFVDHEEDDATYPFPANKTAHDRFLNILCEPIESEDQDDEYVPPQYPVYDERQPWDQMKPTIAM